MPLALPNLDDRRWDDLVEEARSLIPLYAPRWTNHNISDPGITLIELMAYIAEMDIYQANCITDAMRRKFLRLLGIFPVPPAPARTVLKLALKDGADPLPLQSGLEFAAPVAPEASSRPAEHEPTPCIPWRLTTAMTVTPAELIAVLVDGGDGRVRDITWRHARRQSIEPFGPDPKIGAALYLGFSQSPPAGVPLAIYFRADRTSADERRRLVDEVEYRRELCRRPVRVCPGAEPAVETVPRGAPPHHSAVVLWEYWSGSDWVAAEVADDTRSLTLSGTVTLTLLSVPETSVGADATTAHFVRCRLASGAFDAAPLVTHIIENAAQVEQSVPRRTTLELLRKAEVVGPVPADGTFAHFDIELAPSGHVAALRFDATGDGQVRVLGSRTAGRQRFTIEAALLGATTGLPNSTLRVEGALLDMDSRPLLYTIESQGRWQQWELIDDWAGAAPGSYAAVLDPVAGAIRFGDGRNGLVPSDDAPALLIGRQTLGPAGNLAAGRVVAVAQSPHNRLLTDFDEIERRLTVSQPLAGEGGFAGETIDQACARAQPLRESIERAVTVDDIEALARQTPGTRIARAAAKPGVHPAIPCGIAPGVVTVIVLPHLPAGRPAPSAGLLRAVQRFLAPRRVLGTQLLVVGPTYLTVSVRAKVQAQPDADPRAVRDAITRALQGLFHPLTGGPDGGGWPVGRDVFVPEIFDVVGAATGVRHVISIELLAGDPSCAQPTCGNVCIGPIGLVTSGNHSIEVEQS